jgi:rubrerythrin
VTAATASVPLQSRNTSSSTESEPFFAAGKEVGVLVAYNPLRKLFGADGTLYECRNCGKSLDEEAEECPACGGSEIAEYNL